MRCQGRNLFIVYAFVQHTPSSSMSITVALEKVRLCYRKKFQGLSELLCRPKNVLAHRLDSTSAKKRSRSHYFHPNLWAGRKEVPLCLGSNWFKNPTAVTVGSSMAQSSASFTECQERTRPCTYKAIRPLCY